MIESNFKRFTGVSSIKTALEKIIKIPKNFLEGSRFKKYIGRKKITFLIFKFISKIINQDNKLNNLEKLIEAFEKSYIEIKQNIENKINTMDKNIIPIMEEISYSIVKGESVYLDIKNKMMNDGDIMDVGVINITLHKNGSWIGNINEPLGIEICMEYMTQKRDYEISLNKNFQLINNTIKMLGKESSEKGKPFEMFMLNCFLNPSFQNKKLSEIPFLNLDSKTSPKWFDKVFFKCKKILKSFNPDDDMQILEKENIMLSPSNKMRLDGLYIAKGQDDLYYLITVAIKSSYLFVNNSISNENLESSCFDNIYTKVEDNKTILDDCEVQYKKFHDHFKKKNIGGEIRILIEFPKFNETFTYLVSEDEKLVVIHLNQENLNLLIDKTDKGFDYLDGFKKIFQIETTSITPKKKRMCKYCKKFGHYEIGCQIKRLEMKNTTEGSDKNIETHEYDYSIDSTNDDEYYVDNTYTDDYDDIDY